MREINHLHRHSRHNPICGGHRFVDALTFVPAPFLSTINSQLSTSPKREINHLHRIIRHNAIFSDGFRRFEVHALACPFISSGCKEPRASVLECGKVPVRRDLRRFGSWLGGLEPGASRPVPLLQLSKNPFSRHWAQRSQKNWAVLLFPFPLSTISFYPPLLSTIPLSNSSSLPCHRPNFPRTSASCNLKRIAQTRTPLFSSVLLPARSAAS
jgi:hypothetical protein